MLSCPSSSWCSCLYQLLFRPNGGTARSLRHAHVFRYTMHALLWLGTYITSICIVATNDSCFCSTPTLWPGGHKIYNGMGHGHTYYIFSALSSCLVNWPAEPEANLKRLAYTVSAFNDDDDGSPLRTSEIWSQTKEHAIHIRHLKTAWLSGDDDEPSDAHPF